MNKTTAKIITWTLSHLPLATWFLLALPTDGDTRRVMFGTGFLAIWLYLLVQSAFFELRSEIRQPRQVYFTGHKKEEEDA